MPYLTINPATGVIIETYHDILDTDLEHAIATAHACYEHDWRHRSVAERARIVSGAAAKLREHAEEYARYVTLEVGKLIGTSRAEVSLSADILDYYAGHAGAFLKNVLAQRFKRSRSELFLPSSRGISPTIRSRGS